MIDLVKILVIAGDGGHGRVSFRREKFVPKGGPDGGKGGDGGHVILRASRDISTLDFYAGKKKFEAKSGGAGGKKKKSGAAAQSLVLEVPLGTKVWLVAENAVAQRRRRHHDLAHTFKRDEVSRRTFTLEAEGQEVPPLEPQSWLLPTERVVRSRDGAASIVSIENVSTSQDFSTNQEPTVNQEPSVSQEPSNSQEPLERQQGELPKELIQRSSQDLLRNFPDKVELITLLEDGQEVILAQGGFGGFGSEHYKGPSNTTPLTAQYGTEGEKRFILLEHKLLADVGLAGFPNAGKSTLLSVLTQARPKIANYPFTTLEPHLGVMPTGWPDDRGRTEVVIADIPGLIEGASEGKGLGTQFLRHIENTKAIFFVLSLEESQVFDDALDDQAKAELLIEQLGQLRLELETYNPELMKKQHLIGINKSDLYPEELRAAITDVFSQRDHKVLMFSAATFEGIPEVKDALLRLVILS
jgi:GTPase